MCVLGSLVCMVSSLLGLGYSPRSVSAEERKKGSVAKPRAAKINASGCKANARKPIMSKDKRMDERMRVFMGWVWFGWDYLRDKTRRSSMSSSMRRVSLSRSRPKIFSERIRSKITSCSAIRDSMSDKERFACIHALSAQTAWKLSKKSERSEKRRGDRSETGKRDAESGEQARACACVRSAWRSAESGVRARSACRRGNDEGKRREKEGMRSNLHGLSEDRDSAPRHALSFPVTRCHAIPSPVNVRSVPSVGCRFDSGNSATANEAQHNRGGGGSSLWIGRRRRRIPPTRD